MTTVRPARPSLPLRAVSASPSMTDFAEFYRHEYPNSVRLAYLLTRSADVAEDLTQDAFTVVHGRYEGLESPGGYLRVTLTNLCYRWHRTNRRDERRLRLVHAGSAPHDVPTEYLNDALGALPYRQRAVLVLRYWSGLSEAEIAKTLNCRPGTVKSLASRALAQLRKEVSS